MYNQEYIVDEIIKKDLVKQYPELKKLIKITSPHEIRGGIMSVLDKDRRVHRDIKFYENLNKECEYKTNTDEIVVNVRKYIEVADCEVKTHGEVMTPIPLVGNMLDTLPKEVWSNKDLKWFDPCAGVGTFQSIIVQRLMKGLKTQIPNPKKRYKHIVEEMIYVCELQAKNLFAFHYVFDKPDIYDLNNFYGSFLTDEFNENMKNEWNIEKFDIIVGNPPYNTSSQGSNGARDLWDKFVFKGHELLIENGFLLYVHPSKWRSPENKIFELFKENNLIYLEIHSDKDGVKTFGAVTRYDFYLLQKSCYNGNTNVIDELGNKVNINLNEWDWLPNYNFDLFKSIIGVDDKCEVIYSRTIYGNDKSWMSNEQNQNNQLPCIYGMYEDGTHSYKYSSIDKGHFGISKIIISGGRYPYPYNDYDGKFGIMNNAFGLVINSKEEGELIKNAINTEKFSQILKATKWSNFQINYKMFKSFRKDFWKEFIND